MSNRIEAVGRRGDFQVNYQIGKVLSYIGPPCITWHPCPIQRLPTPLPNTLDISMSFLAPLFWTLSPLDLVGIALSLYTDPFP